ncbi:uncharacterized protein LOC141716908 [Apium graveolens]|uniref:uncharacterized protein LOC141716908 n=1 Tax=Apium graveolens TaxID=4045 RepID=UPI003D78DDC7
MVLMSNTVDPRARRELVRVKIQPSERWTGGSTFPLRAFKIFKLPHDAVAYEGRRRDELVDRCKGRMGRFLADFMHVLEDYKEDAGKEVQVKLESEVSALKEERKRLKVSFTEADRRTGDFFNNNAVLFKHVEEFESSEKTLAEKVEELENKLRDAEKDRDASKVECEGFGHQLEGINGSYKATIDEIVKLKADVKKSVEDIASALGNGYGCCFQRFANTGFNIEGHSFQDYIRDFATLQVENPNDGEQDDGGVF